MLELIGCVVAGILIPMLLIAVAIASIIDNWPTVLVVVAICLLMQVLHKKWLADKGRAM